MGLLNVNQYVKLQSLTKCQTINSFYNGSKIHRRELCSRP